MLVSVIVPCYNQGTYLNEALESVFKQTYNNWECLIIDDGSTDNTKEIANLWITKDSKFKYYYKNNGGVSSARNVGISKSKGDFLQFLDSDDILYKSKFKDSLEYLIPGGHQNNYEIVISNFKMLSEDSQKILPAFCTLKESYFSLEGFLLKWNVDFSIQIQCGLFSANLFKGINFPENLSAQEDWVVWVLLMKATNKVFFLDKDLAYYRTNLKSRMQTIGIDDNQIKVLGNFRALLTSDEYYKLTVNLLINLSNAKTTYKNNLNKVKNSNSYQTVLMVKKIITKLKLVKPAKSIFKILLSLKKEQRVLNK